MTITQYNTHVTNQADGLYRFVYHNINDEEQAKDIVQDTFERFWVNKEKVLEGKAKSYLFTTAYRRMIDVLRKEKRIARLDEVKVEPLYKETTPDLKQLLYQALDTLPEMQRIVVLLRDLEGYDYREIGTITNLTESQVKVYIFRARATLRERLVSVETII